MKDENVKIRISNFFNNIFDDESEHKRMCYIDYCYRKVMLLRRILPKISDTHRIMIAIENTLTSFNLIKGNK